MTAEQWLQLATIICGALVAIFGKRKLDAIHVLVNSRLEEALRTINTLKADLAALGAAHANLAALADAATSQAAPAPDERAPGLHYRPGGQP